MSPTSTSTTSSTASSADSRPSTGTPQVASNTAPEADPTLSLWQLGAYAEHPRMPTTMPQVPSRQRRSSASSVASATANRTEHHSSIEPEAGQHEASSRFVVLQKWEGTVLDTTTRSFAARLIDLTGDKPDHVAIIRSQEVSPRDKSRIQPDAIFYWYVGYRDSLSGERERASKFYFRRLPLVAEPELDRARNAMSGLRSSLGWHK